MFAKVRLAAATLFALAAASTSFAGHFDTLASIDAEEASGSLAKGSAALYRLYAHLAPERLPYALTHRPTPLALAATPSIERCATLDLINIRRALPAMTPAERAEALALLGDEAESAVAPRISTMEAGKSVTHSLTYWAETANFSIEWGQDLTNEDGTVPVRDDNDNNIPDAVELWAAYFENAYAKIRAMGFNDVPDLNTYKIKILIGNSDPYTTVDNINTGYYGVTQGAMPHVSGSAPARIVVNGNLNEIVQIAPNDLNDISLAEGIHGAMMVTAAHELHHVFQFLYAPSSWASGDVENTIDWFLEGTSTWMEDEVYPFVNDYAQYYDSTYGWQRFPEMTLAVNTLRPYSNTYIRRSRVYGSAIFPRYLSEHVGGPSTVAAVWAGLKADDGFEVSVAAAANTSAGLSSVWTMDEVFLGFAGANATMDYEDGLRYGTTPRRSTTNPETLGSSLKDYSVGASGGVGFSTTGSTALSLVVASNTSTDKYALVIPKASTSAAITANSGEVLTGVTAGPATGFTSTFAAAAVADTTAPAKVTGLALTPAQAGFLAEWNAVGSDASLAGYVVEWKKPDETKWNGRAIAGRMTKALVRGLEGAALYDVRVFAYDEAANRGVPSDGLQATTLAAIGYPAAAVFVSQSGVNFSPWFEPIDPITVDPGTLVTFTVTATDPEGVDLEYAATGLPAGAGFNLSTRVFTWTPTTSQSGNYIVTFIASDGANDMKLKVNINVTGDPSSGGGGDGGGGGGGCLIDSLLYR